MSANRLSMTAAAWLALSSLGTAYVQAIGVVQPVPDAQWTGGTNTQATAETDDPSGSAAFDAKSAAVAGAGRVDITSTASNSYGGVTGTASSQAIVVGSAAQHSLTSWLLQQTPAQPSSTYGDASALFSYSLLITGPTPLVPVRVRADGALAGSFSGAPTDFGGLGYSNLTITDAAGSPGTELGQISQTAGFGLGAFSDINNQVPSSFNLDGIFQAATNSVYTIDLSLTSTAYMYGTPTGSGWLSLSATVDPWFVIVDPNAADYSILLSPGVGNSPAVPDSGAVVFLLGLAGGALALTRRLFR